MPITLRILENYAYPIIEISQILSINRMDPPHWALNFRASLDDAFPDSWIGRGGPTAWPARSPDVIPVASILRIMIVERTFPAGHFKPEQW